jgi:hydroxyethylthiazole kinase-like uncharacterized protein yjeF
LLQEGYAVTAVVLQYKSDFTAAAQHHYSSLQQAYPEHLQTLQEGQFLTDIHHSIVIIDAILGTGINKPLNKWLTAFIDNINLLNNEVIAIDMPTGLPADTLPNNNATVLRAQFTLSFQLPKRTFFHLEGHYYTGEIVILPIDLSENFEEHCHTTCYTITKKHLQSFLQQRHVFGHKGKYGRINMVGGSYGKVGAIALSAYAAMRAGAGLVTIHAPACAYDIAQTYLPEAMFKNTGSTYIDDLSTISPEAIVGIGPGMGQNDATQNALLNWLRLHKASCILDADALNIIASQPEHLQHIPAGSIITPHPKEFERLFGHTAHSLDQVELGRSKAMKYNIYIVLKGHHTAVLCPDGTCWYNTTGNAGMATGGSGDVLTGIISSLLGQGYSSQQAALLGVFLQGLSGNMALEQQSMESLIARDIVDHLGIAFKWLRS